MFESIAFFNHDRHNSTRPLNIGQLVECMLFYGQTTVFANQGIIRQLLLFFGIEGVIELIEENLLKLVFSENSVGIHTRNNGSIDFHDAIHYSLEEHTFLDQLIKICRDITGKSGKGRRIALRIRSLIEIKNSESIVLAGARSTILNQELITTSAKKVIEKLIPESIDLTDLAFNTEKTANGIVIATNLDFKAINSIYHKYVPPSHSTISKSLILSHILSTENELWYTSQSSAEISTSLLSSELISLKVNKLLDRTIKSEDQINKFQDFVFDESKALRDAVNNENVEAKEIIALLKNAKKFKKWISGIDPDQDLIKSYHKEVTRETFVDNLPGKTTRWAVFTGAGLVLDATLTGGLGILASQGISALDSLLLDKLIQGWRPNQFIEDEILPRLND